jgi:hypothetical protein
MLLLSVVYPSVGFSAAVTAAAGALEDADDAGAAREVSRLLGAKPCRQVKPYLMMMMMMVMMVVMMVVVMMMTKITTTQ